MWFVDLKKRFYYIWGTLKIDIAQKFLDSKDFRVVWTKDDAPEIFEELHLQGELTAQLLLSPEGENKCLLTGTLSGVQILTCARTLELFDQPFETEMVLEVERCSMAKQELDEEIDDVFAYRVPQNQSFVDVSECVRQLIILQEPLRPVKNPEENFIFVSNKPSDAESIDPRWEKLKALKSQIENRS